MVILHTLISWSYIYIHRLSKFIYRYFNTGTLVTVPVFCIIYLNYIHTYIYTYCTCVRVIIIIPKPPLTFTTLQNSALFVTICIFGLMPFTLTSTLATNSNVNKSSHVALFSGANKKQASKNVANSSTGSSG